MAVSSTITAQGIFLLKLVCVAGYFLILLAISKMIQSFIDSFTSNALFSNFFTIQNEKIRSLKSTNRVEEE